MWEGTRGSDLDIEGKTPFKSGGKPAKFGGKFPCNLH